MSARRPLVLTLLTIGLLGPLAATAQPSGLRSSSLRAEILYGQSVPTSPATGGQRNSGWAALHASVDAIDKSPIDTLHMSLVERAFWSRHGLIRSAGLFHTDAAHPVNDLRRIARIRRKMLSLHQTLGLVTVASMAVTVIGGQRAIDGKGSGLHKASLPVTISLYSVTATLAIASPPKLIPHRGGIDSMTFHKAFALAHVAGMILTPLLAPELEHRSTEGNASLHQTLGYATFGAFAAGMAVVTFLR